MNELEEQRLASIGTSEKNIQKRCVLLISGFTLLNIIYMELLLYRLNILNVSTACISLAFIIFVYVLLFNHIKYTGSIYLLTHPFYLKKIYKSTFKFKELDLMKVNISELNIDDMAVIDGAKKQYIISKYVLNLFLYFYILGFVSIITNFILFKLLFLESFEFLLITLAIIMIFMKKLNGIIFKNYGSSLDSLYEGGYITPKQYKAVHFFDSFYIGCDNILSMDDCMYALKSDINSFVILNKVNEYKFNTLKQQIYYTSLCLCLYIVINNLSTYYYYLLLLAWFIFVSVESKIVDIIKIKKSKNIKSNSGKYMNSFTEDLTTMNYFIIRTLPSDKLKNI